MQASPAEVEKYLSGVDYPASKERLISHAKSQNATQEVLDVLGKLAEGDYQSPVDITKEIGNMNM